MSAPLRPLAEASRSTASTERGWGRSAQSRRPRPDRPHEPGHLDTPLYRAAPGRPRSRLRRCSLVMGRRLRWAPGWSPRRDGATVARRQNPRGSSRSRHRLRRGRGVTLKVAAGGWWSFLPDEVNRSRWRPRPRLRRGSSIPATTSCATTRARWRACRAATEQLSFGKDVEDDAEVSRTARRTDHERRGRAAVVQAIKDGSTRPGEIVITSEEWTTKEESSAISPGTGSWSDGTAPPRAA